MTTSPSFKQPPPEPSFAGGFLTKTFRPRRGYADHPLKTWPYTWRSLRLFAAAFVIMTIVWTAVGLAVTTFWEPSDLGQAEQELSLWLEANRSDNLNIVARLASVPSDTWVKVGLIAVLAAVFPLVFRRWHDWAFLLGALVLEVCVYGASSTLVGRERPPVERLTSAPTQSFPSGHMAAAVTFYIGLAMVVWWNTDKTKWRVLAAVGGLIIPVGMFMSRLYLGMHYVTDMIGGIALGAASLVVALNIAKDGLEETLAAKKTPVERQVVSLDTESSDRPVSPQKLGDQVRGS